MKKAAAIVCCAALLGGLSGCGEQNASQDFYAMDTVMSISVYGRHAQDAVNDCVSYINTLEQEISRTQQGSDIYALNHAEGEPVEVSDEVQDVLQRALELARQTDGCFEPTIAPLSDLWAIGTDHAAIPAQQDIDAALQHVGYQQVQLDGNAVTLPAGAQLDLGGIGKGYAADRVRDMLEQAGISRGLVSLGGNIYAIGEKENGVPWTVGISDPDEPGSYFATLAVSDCSVVTSGDYERYFEQDGKRYCHIFDPTTGYPAESDLRSVTIVSESSTQADAFATALFVMGSKKAQEFCAQNAVEAVFVLDDHTVIVTDGLADCFVLTNSEYKYAE